MGQVILVTGASSGIGRACAARLVRAGHRVYGGSRHPEPGAESTFLTIRIDVSDDASVDAALAQILELEKGIDSIVLSAGFSMLGAVEDTAASDARDIFETNYWGVVRIIQAVLPVMRRRGGGHIVVISSVAGRMGVPFRAYYSSTKFALEGFCEALSLEVAGHGIKVSLVAPGHVPTRLGANRRKVAASRKNPAYADAFDRCVTSVEQQDAGGTDAEAVAELVAEIIADPAPKLRYTIGSFTERAGILLRNLLPDRLFRRILMRHYRPR
jgi:NAD(P)-dependent dehydrogenase (short-subunit alcohol dehydrogenase family)